MHLAPADFRIRLMEPGEAEALHALGLAAGLFAAEPPDLPDFVRWLLHHEVFVADRAAGGPVGFAAARDATDLYWLSGIAIDEAFKGRGLRRALLGAVVARAGWFFHRAVGLGVSGEDEADWYRRHRFLKVAAEDRTEALIALAREVPGFAPEGFAPGVQATLGEVLVGSERTVMLHWL